MKTFFFFVGFTVVEVLLHGIVISILWGWFMAPTFGLPKITIPVAAGIAILISTITNQYVHREEETLLKVGVYNLVMPVMAFIVGWILHFFV